MTNSHLLPADEVLRRLPSGWGVGTLGLEKTYIFNDFQQAFAFATRIALLAERLDHHPVLRIDYRVVEIGIMTHDVRGITERDLTLANAIQAIS